MQSFTYKWASLYSSIFYVFRFGCADIIIINTKKKKKEQLAGIIFNIILFLLLDSIFLCGPGVKRNYMLMCM